jgi:hypothetical protein
MSLCNESQFDLTSLSALAFGTQWSCEVTVSTNRREKIMENYHRICDRNSPMERCPKLVTYRLFQIVIVAGRRERNVKWHPLSDDRKHIWQQCDHCARHFLQEPACLFVSPQKHTHPVLLAMVLEEVWFTRLVSPQQVSLQTFVFLVCGDRIGELVIYLKVQRETERSHKQLERD